ncbi:MAG TPA: amidase domain-containing protein [Candidatus Cryosericum sp.]
MRERQKQVRSVWVVILVMVFSLVLSLPVIPQSSPLGIPQARAAVSYNRSAAIAYAEAWAKTGEYLRNYPTYYDYDIASHNPTGLAGGDCANFVSQCLIAGGYTLSGAGIDPKGCFPYSPDLGNWLVRIGAPTPTTWDRAKMMIWANRWCPSWFVAGDVAMFWSTTNSAKHHFVFATVGDNSNIPLYNCHSTDYSHIRFQNFFEVSANAVFDMVTFYDVPESATTPPAAPTPISPSGTIQTTTPTLTWTGVSGCDLYGLYISKEPYGSANVIYFNESVSGSATALPLPSGYLQNGVNYRWNMRAHNSAGWSSYSSPVNFSVALPSTGPTVTTNGVTFLGQTSVILNATVNPNGKDTYAYFQWGTTTAYGNTSTPQDKGSGTSDVFISQPIAFLTPGQLYHYQAIAYDTTPTEKRGLDQTFTTLPLTTYTITASSDTGGTISPSGSVVVNQGSSQTFTISASSGYHIAGVSVDGVSQGAISSYTFPNVQASHTIVASFAVNTVGDQYEPDNDYQSAKVISTGGTPQTHTIDPAGDNDWMKFNATAGVQYIIETGSLLGGLDTYMYLYGPDGTTEIVRNDDVVSGTLSSRIVWTCTTSATYYVRVHNYYSSGGPSFGYNIWITSPPSMTVTSPMNGTVWNVGETHSIIWTVFGDTSGIDHFLLGYSVDGGLSYNPLDYVSTAASTARSYSWVIPNVPTSQAKIIIGGIDSSDNPICGNYSDGLFTILSTMYTLTTTTSPSSGGTIARSPNAASYPSGTVVTLTATPATGYTLTGWSGSLTGTTNPTTITMTGVKSVTASFAVAPSYALTVGIVGSGFVVKSPNLSSYASGTVVTLTATPNPGYIFTGWSGDLTGSTNPTTITMTGNKTVIANFTAGVHLPGDIMFTSPSTTETGSSIVVSGSAFGPPPAGVLVVTVKNLSNLMAITPTITPGLIPCAATSFTTAAVTAASLGIAEGTTATVEIKAEFVGAVPPSSKTMTFTWNFTGTDTGMNLALSAGWNLVSVAVPLPVASITGLQSVYGYHDGWSVPTTLVRGEGYWVQVQNVVTVPLPGTPLTTPVSITYQAGWQLLGNPFDVPLPISSITNHAYITTCYSYGPAWGVLNPATDSLQPGKGYWIQLSSSATLTLTRP